MATNASQPIEIDDRARRRAKWELFSFRVAEPGHVEVTNESYGAEAEEHTYTVAVEEGAAAFCDCPAFRYQPGLCKHAHAVNNEPVLLATVDQSNPLWVRASATGLCPNGTEGCESPDGSTLPCFDCYDGGESGR